MDTIQVSQWRSLNPGPKLIVLGAVHGNETCGTVGITRVIEKFNRAELRLSRGQVTFVPITNPKAYRQGKREGDRNLNRDFRPSASPETAEDRIANFLAPLLASHDVLVDLHSFTSQGEPFIFIGPENNQSELEPFQAAATEEALASVLGPTRIVHGWMSAYASGVARRKASGAAGAVIAESVAYGIGTTEYMRAVGGAACTVECGNHADVNAPEVAHLAVMNALAHLQLIDTSAPSSSGPKEVIELAQVFDRKHESDRFTKTWRSFDRVAQGTAIASYADGSALNSPDAGYVVFPNPNTAVGREWFYFGRPSARLIP
jgi:uncharacterized protein